MNDTTELPPSDNIQPLTFEEDKARASNMTADDLFFAAQDAAKEASQHGMKQDRFLLDALQYTMALREHGKKNGAEVEALFHHHNVKDRKGLDIYGRLVKLVFPLASAPLKNCYANALRFAERQGKTSDELKIFIAQPDPKHPERHGVAYTATLARPKKPDPDYLRTHITKLDGAPAERTSFTVKVEKCEKGGFDILIPKPPTT
jgi:hypothetical protein